jgi:adenosylcobinamide kinase/adenosylcobinamide-phosphate guanylyltransferase
MIHLVLGGARSGKSRFAELRVAEYAAIGYQCVYLATALHNEMSQRIDQHQQDRVSSTHGWTLHEQAYDIAQTLVVIDKPQQVIMLDCLTLLLTNHLLLNDGASWEAQKSLLVGCLSSLQSDVVIVSNEVGSGIVPMGELNRRFVDEAGWLNQAIAAISDQVTLVVAGLPLTLKA